MLVLRGRAFGSRIQWVFVGEFTRKPGLILLGPGDTREFTRRLSYWSTQTEAVALASVIVATTFACAAIFAASASAQSQEPIRIGVIAEVQAIGGASTPGGAQIAADGINAKGGVNGREIEILI